MLFPTRPFRWKVISIVAPPPRPLASPSVNITSWDQKHLCQTQTGVYVRCRRGRDSDVFYGHMATLLYTLCAVWIDIFFFSTGDPHLAIVDVSRLKKKKKKAFRIFRHTGKFSFLFFSSRFIKRHRRFFSRVFFDALTCVSIRKL